MRNFNWLRYAQYLVAVTLFTVAAMVFFQFQTEWLPFAEQIPTGPIAPAILVVIGMLLVSVDFGERLNKLMPKKSKAVQPNQTEHIEQTGQTESDPPRANSGLRDRIQELVEKFGWAMFIIGMVMLVIGVFSFFTGNSIFVRLVGVGVIVVSGGILWFPVWPIVHIWLAERAILWFIVPEAHAAFVMRYGKLERVVVNASGERREHFEALAKLKFQQHGYYRLVLVEKGKEIMWLGWPWERKLLPPFFEHSDDAKNPAIQPVRFLSLKKRNIDYDPLIERDGRRIRGVIPNEDTIDPVEITSKLVVTGWVWDPEAALFEVELFLEAMQKDIVARWRRVVTELSYFMMRKEKKDSNTGDDSPPTSTEKISRALTEEEIGITPGLQREAYRLFNVEILGIGGWNEVDNQFYPYHPKVVQDKTTRKWRITDSKDSLAITGFEPGFVLDSPAETSLRAYGFELDAVEISKLAPTSKDVREALRGKSTKLAKAAADVQAAKGYQVEQMHIGRGDAARISETAKGEQKRLELEGEGVALALGSQARILKKEPDAYAILAAKTAVEVAAGTELVVTEGGLPGIAGTLAKVMQAVRETVPATAATPTTSDESDVEEQES